MQQTATLGEVMGHTNGHREKAAAQLRRIPVDQLLPHPDNPRLSMRDDVVERLAAEIARAGFRPEHALLVRPWGDCYQIVSGHHRHAGAVAAGLDSVPCWVREWRAHTS